MAMKKYTISFYNDKVEEEILDLPTTLRARYLRYADIMQDAGVNLGLPHTKFMGDGLFELRLKGQEGIARVFYCLIVENEIIMLHSFVKKTDKTPTKELNIAKKRMKEVKNG